MRQEPGGDVTREPERWRGPGIGGAGALDQAVPPHAGRPSHALWLFYLYFRPVKFFRHFVDDHLWITTAICAWIFGISSVADRMQRNASMGRPIPFSDSWTAYLALLAGGGVAAAAIFFALGGWWYRLRLKWSGASSTEPALVRRVYIYSSTVQSLPAVLTTVWEAGTYATPMDAFNAPISMWNVVILIFPFWSLVTSYVGVRTVFEVRGWRPLVWFLVLPGAVYLLAFAVMAVAMLLMLTTAAPQVASPHRYSEAGVSMSLPGDWQVDTTNADYEPGVYVPIAMPQNARLEFYFYSAEHGTPQEIVLKSVNETMGEEPDWTLGPSFTVWGSFRGAGRALERTVDGETEVIRYFAVSLPNDQGLHVYEYFLKHEEFEIRPGFDLLANSLRIESGTPGPALNRP